VPVRVAKGAQLLDRCRPGWAAEVDPDRLDLRLEEDDVLGQLYGTFHQGLDELAASDPAAQTLPDTWAAWHGFDLAGDEPARRYVELTAGWQAEIARRRGGER